MEKMHYTPEQMHYMEKMHQMPMNGMEKMHYTPMMKNAIADDSYSLTIDQAYVKGRMENFARDKKKVIMGRMPEAAKKKEFFTNKCGM